MAWNGQQVEFEMVTNEFYEYMDKWTQPCQVNTFHIIIESPPDCMMPHWQLGSSGIAPHMNPAISLKQLVFWLAGSDHISDPPDIN